MREWMLVLWALCLVTVSPQAYSIDRKPLFEGLTADRNVLVTPDQPVMLPVDHGPHWPFQIEWWYLTLLLENESGEPFNYQFTLFKFARPELQSNWGEGYMWMAHSSLHTPSAHYFNEKFAQHGTGIAGFTTQPLSFFIENWQWQSQERSSLFPASLEVSTNAIQLSLKMVANGEFVKHGKDGVSDKSTDGYYRSYYYSQPFIDASGTITIAGKRHNVSGIGWYDHEWTSQLTDDKALGWDWFSLHFDDGRKLMAFNMHVENSPVYSTGSLVSSDGELTSLEPPQILIEPLNHETVAGRSVPLEWRISIPDEHISITTTAFKTEQWNAGRFPYYEGALSFSGSHIGKGFMELTGY